MGISESTIEIGGRGGWEARPLLTARCEKAVCDASGLWGAARLWGGRGASCRLFLAALVPLHGTGTVRRCGGARKGPVFGGGGWGFATVRSLSVFDRASATSHGAPIAIAERRRWLSVEHDAH